jgi:DNA-directed RNA polymerase subunit RPC12/RpoP
VKEVRYFTKATLIQANGEAIASERNRTLVPEKLDALPDKKFPVVFSFVHNDLEARCQVVLDENGTSALLDVPLAAYNSLPVAVEHDDGSVEFREPMSYQMASEAGAFARESPLVSDVPDDSDLETAQAYKCVECGEISEEAGDRLYECGDCGTTFTRENSADGMSHRCPDCSRFAAKVTDQSCVECQEGEAEEITAYKCPRCGVLYEDEEEALSCCE